MNSIDTNVLIHALDQSAPGHKRAYEIYRRMFSEVDAWIVADQTLFELYRALRNPKFFETPLDGVEALEIVEQLRDRSQVRSVAYESRLWREVTGLLRATGDRRGVLVFDIVLAVTLKAGGVKRFYTRNTKDFEGFGFFEVVDPLVE